VRHIATEPDAIARAILTLVTHPRTWVHFTPTELKAEGDLHPMDALIAHAEADGYQITTLTIPGDPDDGFYAMLL
jgi:hypothetical protein